MTSRNKKADSPTIDKAASQYLLALVRAIDDGDDGQRSLAALLIQRPIDPRLLLELARTLRGTANRQHQQNAANKKHSQNKKAKKFASQEWVIKRRTFASNIEFCRELAPLILKKFEVAVKPETIARDWVKCFDIPHGYNRPANSIAYADGRYFAERKRLSLPSTK